jgi:PAS domain-containing protein
VNRLTASLDDMLPLHPDALAPTDINSESLFAASAQAVLIVDADTGNILRANPATSLLLKLPPTVLIGAPFLSVFEDASANALKREFSTAKTSGSAAATGLRERIGGRCMTAQLSLVRSLPQCYVLARLEASESTAVEAPRAEAQSAVMEALDAAPMGFLIAAADFHVDYANRAFVTMVKAQSQTDVRGSSIFRWLRFNAADLSRLSARLSQRQAADVLTTVLHPNFGLPQQVQVCAVPVPDGLNTQWGFTVRHLPRLN